MVEIPAHIKHDDLSIEMPALKGHIRFSSCSSRRKRRAENNHFWLRNFRRLQKFGDIYNGSGFVLDNSKLSLDVPKLVPSVHLPKDNGVVCQERVHCDRIHLALVIRYEIE